MDNYATFCGTNKERGGGGVIKEGHMHGGMTDVAVHHACFSLQTLFLAIYAFVGGFLSGCKMRPGKVSSKKL